MTMQMDKETVTEKLPSNTGIDVDWLHSTLLGTWKETRLAARERMLDPQFHKIEDQTIAEHRARTLAQMKTLVEMNAISRAYPKQFGGHDDHGGSIAAFEELLLGDPSLQIKAGVQWGLFGSAILHLGNETHHKKYLPGVLSLDIPGAFAMTETGHGSDVASIGTTATYDPATEEFIINTPFRAAWKDYLGNAALHGEAAVVFAQLITGRVNHGVHAFFVPIRDKKGNFFPGVGGEDDGHKGGLNGIDNGRLHFTNVRIPREDLLDRYGKVAKDGSYSSPIASPGRRFFTMLGTLVQGRVSLDGSAVLSSKVALDIALTYAHERRQFVGEGEDEVLLIDYQRHQRRLIPLLAATFAANFSHDKLLRKFDDVFSGRHDTEEYREDLETYAAALKPASTWLAMQTLQETREATGGAGFLSENRITSLHHDMDVFVTFEGDNNVLLQLVGKRLLTDFAKKFKKNPVGVYAGYLSREFISRSGLRRVGQGIRDGFTKSGAISSLSNPDRQIALLQEVINQRIFAIAAKLNKASKSKSEAVAVFNENQNALIEVALVYSHVLHLQDFNEVIESATDLLTKQVLEKLRDLYAMVTLQKNLSWIIANGKVSPRQARALEVRINQLLKEIKPYLLDLVASFGFEDAHVRAKIRSGAEEIRQQEARSYYEQQRESGMAPTPEKSLKKQKQD